ncbi:hypothetical protein [Silvibacterium acidisoli]|uniref:hypothetical protein n=1 Tax=Acidobacteriaceae bacterium ZG23-2 TaxID=2883246 RepID=UPI00406C03EB
MNSTQHVGQMPVRPLPPFEKSCAGKDQYPSENSAIAALDMMKRGEICHPRNNGRWDTLAVYECHYCGCWHHGHP